MLESVTAWLNGLTGIAMSIHGWIAVVLTVVGVLALWWALFWLVQKSHSSGHDDAVRDYRDPRGGADR